MQDAGERIEVLLDELHRTTDPGIGARVDEVVQTLVGVYGDGLARIVGALVECGAYDAVIHDRLVKDPVVSALLLLHNLHPDDVRTRVEEALEAARPVLASHAGGVTLLEIRGVIARVKLEGACGTCASSMATVRGLLERAVHEAAPEIDRLEIVQPDQPTQLVQLGRRPQATP
jgi:Fe-S cluster biogenesis protein NfuA